MRVLSHLMWELTHDPSTSPECNHGIDLMPFDLRLQLANRIVDISWKQRKQRWSREEIADLLFEVLYDQNFDWDRPMLLDDLKAHLATAYAAAHDVLPIEQRDF